MKEQRIQVHLTNGRRSLTLIRTLSRERCQNAAACGSMVAGNTLSADQQPDMSDRGRQCRSTGSDLDRSRSPARESEDAGRRNGRILGQAGVLSPEQLAQLIIPAVESNRFCEFFPIYTEAMLFNSV
jgi:hypothetical protein